MKRLGLMLAAAAVISITDGTAHAKMAVQTFPVQAGVGAHDVYPAPDGTVWFTAQSAGKLGRLDPKTGKSDLIALGPGAAPHGVIVGPGPSAIRSDLPVLGSSRPSLPADCAVNQTAPSGAG